MSNPTSTDGAKLSSAEIPGQIDLIISLHLHLWPALTITIQNGWGTSNPQIGEDKRDWLAGAISDLFAQNQLRDLEDLEEVLEQVMNDEFEVDVDDGSLEEVARKIWKSVETLRKGDGSEVQSLMAVWNEKKKTSNKTISIVRGHGDQAEDNSSGDDDDDDEYADHGDDHGQSREAGLSNGFHGARSADAGAMDIDMDDALPVVNTSRRRTEPEVDEDGFTTVVSNRRR